jgi:hypothetical protein
MSTSSPKADIDASLEQTTLDYPKLAMALGGGRRGFVGTALSAASECLLLAQSGHHDCPDECLLSGIKRT